MKFRVVDATGNALVDGALRGDGWTPTSGDDWDLWWGWQAPTGGSESGPRLVAHLAGARALDDKAHMHRLLWAAHTAAGPGTAAFFPRTFEMPFARAELMRVAGEEPQTIWIAKESALNSGRGNRVLLDASEAPDDPGFVVQEYLSRPDLIDGFKYTIRIYVLISSLDPLVVHIYRDGFVKRTTQPYTRDRSRLSDPFVHLTNPDIQRHAPGPPVPVLTLAAFARTATDFAERWARIRHVAALTVLAARDALLGAQRQAAGYTGFAIVGMDILFDEQRAAWLIECNLPPSLKVEAIGEGLDEERDLKLAVVSDAVRLVVASSQAGPAPDRRARAILESAGQFELLVPSEEARTAGETWLIRRADQELFEAVGLRPPAPPRVRWPDDAVLYDDGAVAFSESQQSFVALNAAATFAGLSCAEGASLDSVAERLAACAGTNRADAVAATEDALAVLWAAGRPAERRQESPARVPSGQRMAGVLMECVRVGPSHARIVFEHALLRDAAAVLIEALGTGKGTAASTADFEVDVCRQETGALVRSGRESCAVSDLRMLPAVLHAVLLRRAYFAPGVAMAVHASAVAGARGAILIAGPSGSGKTTLASALVAKGLALVADEAGIIDRDWNIEPAAAWLALRAPALDLFDRTLFADALPTCRRADGSTAHLFIPARRAERRMPVRAMVFPRIVGGSESELVPLGIPATVMKLAEAGIEMPNRLTSAEAHRLIAGLAAVPRFEARMGTIDSSAALVVMLGA